MLLRRLTLLAAWLLPLLAAPPTVRAQTTQFWPEYQFSHLFTPVDQGQFMFRLHDNLSRGELTRAVVGTRWAHSFNKFFEGAVGYRHDNSVRRAPYDENRAYLDQIGRFDLPEKFGGDLRLREEFRWTSRGFSVRLRPGLLVRRRVEIGDYTVLPYLGSEAFWDSRFNRVTYLRLTAGAAFPIYKGFSVNPYFHYQFDPAGILPSTNIIGLLMLTRF